MQADYKKLEYEFEQAKSKDQRCLHCFPPLHPASANQLQTVSHSHCSTSSIINLQSSFESKNPFALCAKISEENTVTAQHSSVSRPRESKTTQQWIHQNAHQRTINQPKHLILTGSPKCAKSIIREVCKESFMSPNPFKVLATEDGNTEENNFSKLCEEFGANKRNSTDKKLLLCADSHGRDLVWRLNKFQHTHKAVGFIRPGGRAEQILNNKSIGGENLTNEEILIIMCGTNDVAVNEASKAVEHIENTLKETSMKHCVVLVDLPQRYDLLLEWSCVNDAVHSTNKQLKDLTKNYSNVSLVESSRAGRQLHTRHGLHLNSSGKRWLAEKICQAVKNFNGKPSTTQSSIAATT